MATSIWQTLKNRYNGRSAMHQTDSEIALSSIEKMRLIIQDSFDKEIDIVVKKYMQVSVAIFAVGMHVGMKSKLIPFVLCFLFRRGRIFSNQLSKISDRT